MDLIERATVLHYHRHRIGEHGSGTAQALGWRDGDSQRLRFELIAQVTDFDGASVLDLGCGTGDLKAFLDTRFSGLRYLGIDQQPEFVATARERFAGAADTEFALAHFDTLALPRADVVVACGALSYRVADPHWLFNTVARLYAASGRMLVLNVLDAAVFPPHPLLVGHDVAALEAFCRLLAPQVEVRRSALPDDVAVVMRRAPA